MICLVCDKEFKKSVGNQVYCSGECQQVRIKERNRKFYEANKIKWRSYRGKGIQKSNEIRFTTNQMRHITKLDIQKMLQRDDRSKAWLCKTCKKKCKAEGITKCSLRESKCGL